MNAIDTRRRQFLKASVAVGGGLVIGFVMPSARQAMASEPKDIFAPNAWIRIAKDDTVTLIVAKVEMGQGVYTSMPMLLAEELEVDLTKIHLEDAPPSKEYIDPILKFQATGGSTSVRSSWKPLGEAGAATRMMLIAAAAETWKVKPADCHAENGMVIHNASNRSLSYGQLAESAARQPIPKKIVLKDAKNFKVIGKPIARRDSPGKVNGSALYGIDIKLPGLLTAMFVPCPVFGGKLKSVDDSAAKAVKGVKHVFQVENGVAVVADGFWAAKQGREALKVQWDEGALAQLDSAAIERQFEQATTQIGNIARKEGDVVAALGKAAKTVEAVYHAPYAPHCTMEPLNCTVDLRADHCDIWVGTQVPAMAQEAVAKVSGLPNEKIKVHITYLGGGFGRRLEVDFITQAVAIAKQAGAPVKLIWTREDDMRHDVYRPASFTKLRAGLDAKGRPTVWEQHIACPSIFKRYMPALLGEDGKKVDPSSVEAAADHPYAIPNVRVDYHVTDPGVPVGFWRSVGNSQNGFFTESFIDELAHAAGQDPLKYRLQLLAKQARFRGVLELAATKAGWGEPLPKGTGRGIAAVFSFASYAAEVAEVEVSANGEINVKRVVCAIDCGSIVNPDTIKAQVEGAVIFALTAALKGPITIKNGQVEQSNFHDYPLLSLVETPKIEVYIIDSHEAPGGVGEPGVPPLAPAVANAIFAATGKRLRRMPFDLSTA